MNRSRFPIRIVGLAVLVSLVCLLAVQPLVAGASPALPGTSKQIPRDTPTTAPTSTDTPTPLPTNTPVPPTNTPLPGPTLVLNPTQGIAGIRTDVTATGQFWTPNSRVTLYWDSQDRQLGSGTADANTNIDIDWQTPTGFRGSVGEHTIIALSNDGKRAEAIFTLLAPTPTTPTPSVTPTASPTLRPITPMVTITPIPLTKVPTRPATGVAPTRTPTRVPGTPTATRTPSPTPGPGTPSATPNPSASPTETPPAEIVDTGGGWGTLFLWGFVLAGLVVAFRLLRVRGMGVPR